MFIIFIMLIAASLATVAGQVYTALTLHAQTVEYMVQAVQSDEYKKGILACALAQLAHGHLVTQIDREKEVLLTCDIFNTSDNGFFSSRLRYKKIPTGYGIEIFLQRLGQDHGGICAALMAEAHAEKILYSCVSLETF